ncbi:exodeoxyribonuclease III [Deltaproteobacteria bacterium]|nr:exodeoxyribonuclease III [Deltaproteobacteria bacterium]
MKIATFNANSIRARMEIITGWLQREEPDILCLQETKVQDKDFPLKPLEMLGYQVIFKGQKSYNGVAIISKKPLDEIRLNLYEGDDEQARFISARNPYFSLINVYVPQGFSPGSDKFEYKLNWMEDLLSYVKGNYDPGLPLLLVGDFNVALEPVDLYDPEGFRGEAGFHPHEQAIMKRILDWGFADIFRQHQADGGHYTFWDYRIPNGFKRKMGWRIDYILATRILAEKVERVWIDTGPRILEKPSDHTFLVAEFDI